MEKKRYSLTAMIYDKKGRVLSIGKNSYVKSHPYQAAMAKSVGLPHKIYLHAEIHAILRCRDLSKAHKIVVYRFDTDGKPMKAAPCPICASAIEKVGIKIIEHT
jgi:tRNA(Arg) A34 adenosine deaminase TadA